MESKGQKVQKVRKILLQSIKLGQLFKPDFWRKWFRKPEDEVTLLLLSKGHLEVQKLRFSPRMLWMMKCSIFGLGLLVMGSAIFLIDYLVHLPEYSQLRRENLALRKELNLFQFHLDTLQTSVDRINRFDQKLRAMTDVNKKFDKMKGPGGQGGGEPEDIDESAMDLQNFQIENAYYQGEDQAFEVLDRKEAFLVQKIRFWMKRLYRDSGLQEQSMEELFEVLKGREIQLLSTPSILPVKGWPTSHFGYRLDPFTGRRAFHKGIDIGARIGAPIMAPADGIVTFAGPYGSFGNTVLIFHGYGITTLYAHTSAFHVKAGDKVKRGDLIAEVGTTGRSSAPHLHYEVIRHGVSVNPSKYIL